MLQAAIILGPALALGLAMNFLARRVQVAAARLVGLKFYIYATAPGTICHELGHAIFAKLFRHRIKEMKLFSPSPDGTLGYVAHAWNRRSLYQNIGNFFIGTGPLWFGALVLWLLALLLLGGDAWSAVATAPAMEPTQAGATQWLLTAAQTVWASGWHLASAIVSMMDLTSWTTYVFIYLVVAIGSHVSLSPPDLAGAGRGLAVLLATLGIFNLATIWIGDFATSSTMWLSSRMGVFYGIMVFVLIANLAVAMILVPLSKVLRG